MTVTSARHDWEEGQRRFDAEALDAARAEALYAQRDAVIEELRRRIGSAFTLAELAALYVDSDQWLSEVIEERAPSRAGRAPRPSPGTRPSTHTAARRWTTHREP